MKKSLLLILAVVSMVCVACNKTVDYDDAEIHVSFSANGYPLTMDSLCCINEAGNRFMVTEIQWFISNITLKDSQGNEYVLGHREENAILPTSQEKIFYIDTNLPATQILEVASLPCQKYISMHFTFGLDQKDNVTGVFSDAPERDMFWPEALGGGYHYMKLNGKYLDNDGNLAPMNIHLGIGQNEDHTVFYQNYFTVELPLDLEITEGGQNVIFLDMNVDNWFRNPNTYDINYFGAAIMQNQAAQQMLKENGNDVFSIKTNDDMESPFNTTAQLLRKAAPKPHFMTWENFKKTIAEVKDRL